MDNLTISLINRVEAHRNLRSRHIMSGVRFSISYIRCKHIYIYMFVFFILLFLNVLCLSMNKTEDSGVPVRFDYMAVHIDLKGAPPKLKYLESLLPLFRKYGVNALVMEYEDMFPYEGSLIKIRAKNSYNKSELTSFLSKANQTGIEIIPLVQTFGHMEYVIKIKEFRDIAEDDSDNSICPSNAKSLVTIKEILKQIITFHSSISPLKNIHVGCDEVYDIRKCPVCKRSQLTPLQLFIKHTEWVSSTVKKLSNNTNVLIWDDMYRTYYYEFGRSENWNPVDESKTVEPVYWIYRPLFQLSHSNLYQYHTKFKNIWIASAFKGADGITNTIPDMRKRYNNALNWMKKILNYKFGGEEDKFQFKGIILTGWSRYKHFTPLVDLLPVSIPSLILQLLVIDKFKDPTAMQLDLYHDQNQFYKNEFQKNLSDELKCKIPFPIAVGQYIKCDYPGGRLYNVLNKKLHLCSSLETSVNNITACKDLVTEILGIDVRTKQLLNAFYSKEVIDEYVKEQQCNTLTTCNLIDKTYGYN